MRPEATKTLPDRTVRLRARDCENCGGGDLEPLWRQFFTARTRKRKFGFDVNNVICRNCGFVFVSPVFEDADLADYYKDSFSAFAGAAPDYDADKRLAFLGGVAPQGNLFVEVGANLQTRFHERLKELYGEVKTVEINDSVNSDHRSLAAMPDASADIVAHYFVLEHIPQVLPFLKECARVLRDGGVMICEVPDIAIYPADPSALQLHEHTNHFSRQILRELAEQAGFAEVAVRAEHCSRPFGFAAAFRKSASPAPRVAVAGQYQSSRELLLAELDRSYRTFQAYQQRGSGVVLWAANDVMARFLDRCSGLGSATIVDSDEKKSGVFRPRKVFTPDAAADAIAKAEGIFIFTGFHAAAILRSIEQSFGKVFDNRSIHIVDPFAAGPSAPPALRD